MQDPRHIKRIKVIENLFAYTFDHIQNNLPYPEDVITNDILKQREKIDSFIEKYAPKYPLHRIAKIDLAILRLAVYELIIHSEQPQKVVIDEAVKLSKEFGGERSFAFVNAVLGKIVLAQNT